MINAGLRDGIGVIADIVFVVIAILADLVSDDGAAILQMDGVSPGTRRSEQPNEG
jgi:hypothetical protein